MHLANHLPPMLAEDDVVQEISREDLMAGLAPLVDEGKAETVLVVVERLFCFLALLRPDRLSCERWRFNSYSAWLVARSLLESLARDEHTLFDPGYWGQQPSDADVDEQRALLRRLEAARTNYQSRHVARPIRFVYVAWAVIKLDDRFLLYAREDKVRSDARGNFGFPGGRFKLTDVPSSDRPPRAEYDFAYGISHWPMGHLHRSLARELHEELHLTEADHYCVGSSIDVTPYCRIEGARNHHAFTEYRIRLYPLQLNIHGLLKIFERLQKNRELFAWFTSAELSVEKNFQGQRAFVTALVEHFGPKLQELTALPPAFSDTYLQSSSYMGVDIPLTHGRPITSGRSGKPLKTHPIQLTEAEHRWLWVLAWHLKSLPLSGSDKITLLPMGWIRVDNIAELASLREKLEASGLRLVEIEEGQYVRLSIHPRLVYFDPEFFRYRLHGNSINGELEILSMGIDTPHGTLKQEPVFIELSATLAGELRHLDGIEPLGNHIQGSDHLRRMLDLAMGDTTKNMGIRQLVLNLDKARQYRSLVIRKYED